MVLLLLSAHPKDQRCENAGCFESEYRDVHLIWKIDWVEALKAKAEVFFHSFHVAVRPLFRANTGSSTVCIASFHRYNSAILPTEFFCTGKLHGHYLNAICHSELTLKAVSRPSLRMFVLLKLIIVKVNKLTIGYIETISCDRRISFPPLRQQKFICTRTLWRFNALPPSCWNTVEISPVKDL
uniref:AlNc14C92G5742 protein n=1 Tax=Albugo laibachii Nc14 TaxID=890382 RepID=F0WGL4_9STRA|nr:AlNc14C92G5742 [Albugo laibachii Nc14]|eukprot:CCA20378.1 AlNc14C92G5742 [Albugo laibachii Nc14]